MSEQNEEKVNECTCDCSGDDGGCCSSGSSGFNWQRFIFTVVVVAACAVAAHSYITGGSGCPAGVGCNIEATTCGESSSCGDTATCGVDNCSDKTSK